MALRDRFEVLIDKPGSERGRRMMEALAECDRCEVTSKYQGECKYLVVYGVGAEHRLRARTQHQARGGHVAMWDLGYWDRDESLRLAVDAFHPTAAQLALAPVGQRKRFELRMDADPDGPILLIAMGNKSAAMLGFQPKQWETAKRSSLRKRFPGKAITLRQKHRNEMPIEEAMRGCSMVVCRHSNVGVDACIAGLPVECEDGAAFALYESKSAPSEDDRREFLRRLGWWNWFPNEAQQALSWIERVTGCA